MTLAIAILGAVTGVVSLLLTIRRDIQDRARLEVKADPATSPDGTARLFFIAENRGRQPVTVGPLGVMWSVEGEMPERVQSGEWLVNNPWDRTLIPAGGSMQVEWPVQAQAEVPVDTPLRAFADVGRRRVYGKPLPLFRLLLELGWRAAPPLPEDLLRPRDLMTRAVVPRWQLWQRKDLRSSERVALPPIPHDRIRKLRGELADPNDPTDGD